MKKKERPVSIKNTEDALKRIDDSEVIGNPDVWEIVCKFSSKSLGIFKSTKAMEIPGAGVYLHTFTREPNGVSESLFFQPGLKLKRLVDGKGNKYVKIVQA